MQWVVSFFLNNHVRRQIRWSGKDITLFQRAQIIGLHQAKKASKESAETTKIGLRAVQGIFKT